MPDKSGNLNKDKAEVVFLKKRKFFYIPQIERHVGEIFSLLILDKEHMHILYFVKCRYYA